MPKTRRKKRRRKKHSLRRRRSSRRHSRRRRRHSRRRRRRSRRRGGNSPLHLRKRWKEWRQKKKEGKIIEASQKNFKETNPFGNGGQYPVNFPASR